MIINTAFISQKFGNDLTGTLEDSTLKFKTLSKVINLLNNHPNNDKHWFIYFDTGNYTATSINNLKLSFISNGISHINSTLENPIDLNNSTLHLHNFEIFLTYPIVLLNSSFNIFKTTIKISLLNPISSDSIIVLAFDLYNSFMDFNEIKLFIDLTSLNNSKNYYFIRASNHSNICFRDLNIIKISKLCSGKLCLFYAMDHSVIKLTYSDINVKLIDSSNSSIIIFKTKNSSHINSIFNSIFFNCGLNITYTIGQSYFDSTIDIKYTEFRNSNSYIFDSSSKITFNYYLTDNIIQSFNQFEEPEFKFCGSMQNINGSSNSSGGLALSIREIFGTNPCAPTVFNLNYDDYTILANTGRGQVKIIIPKFDYIENGKIYVIKRKLTHCKSDKITVCTEQDTIEWSKKYLENKNIPYHSSKCLDPCNPRSICVSNSVTLQYFDGTWYSI